MPRLKIALAVSLLALVSPNAARAQSAEAAYLAKRDAAIAEVKRRDAAGGEVTDQQTQDDMRVLQRLEAALRRIVGPVRVAGFPGAGKINLSTLSRGDIGFGALDALTIVGADGKANLYVTTDALLSAWLGAHRKWWEDQAPMPQQARDALRREAFYTQAISADAAVILYVPLAIAQPARTSFVLAQLEATTQDQPPPLPDTLLVAVARDGKLFIVEAPLQTAFGAIAACETMRRDFDERIAKLSEAQSRKPDEAAADAMTKLMGEASAAAMRCFRDHAAREPAFSAAGRQAQALVDRLVEP